MTIWRRVGLRVRLALALAAVAVISVALATVLADSGLNSRLNKFAHGRLQGAATHSAQLAATMFRDRGRLTPGIEVELDHLARMSGYRLVVSNPSGRSDGQSRKSLKGPRADAPILVAGSVVGTVTVSPLRGDILTEEDRKLNERVNHLHLLAGALALALGLLAAGLLAPALARPLRRLTEAARKIQSGDLQAHVVTGGAPEIRELGQAFNRLAETLAHEEEIRREAAADVAHELRTPLAGIVSRIEAAQDGVLPDERKNLEAMHTEALRLTRLIEDLGKLAEAQRPGLTLRKAQVDLRELAHERAQVYEDDLSARGLSLKEQLSPAIAYGDRERIVQITDNLLLNALRYTDAGGEVSIAVSEHNGEALLEIADTGVGISGEDLPYIFERFWRSEPSRARRTGGAGIGLAIVRELVRAHNGRIDVESRPGHGSRFRVVLPAASRQS